MTRFFTSPVLSISAVLVFGLNCFIHGKTVDLGYATYRSDLTIADGVTSFLGIRYAASPEGNLRWREPQLPQSISGIQDATKNPTQCYQASLFGSPGLSTSNPYRTTLRSGTSTEDCLFLNVHVPTEPKKALLPVIVYIHGGGYDAGNISLYPVQDFVKDSGHQVVSVSIQYRLGVFGFLAGNRVRKDGALNAGLLDQNFALQWVQTHIKSFGGDPSRVTIWGQSAGAGSMLQHLVAHGGNTQPTLFRAVLMNSPFLPFQYHYSDPIPEKVYTDVVSSLNCTSASDTLNCLRAADPLALLNADTAIGKAGFLWTYTFVPVVDETFIIESPTLTLSRGRANGKALVVSTNTNEGTFFVPAATIIAENFTLRSYTTELFPRMDEHHVEHIRELYSNTGTVPEQAAAVMGDSIFACPAYYALHAFKESGWKAAFAIPPAVHAQDLSYEFSTFGIPPTFANADFQAAFQAAFLSTAISLDPNTAHGTIAPKWPAYIHEKEMIFNKTESDQPVVHTTETDEDFLSRCAYVNSLSKA
ncbi:alpha/beta-hydrolase [Mycena floridula]|nr:alpha/beta-hydrolase [Mycena floridula]